jgi:hypothetical protein
MRESKVAKEVKVKMEPGVNEGSLSAAKVGVKRKFMVKVDDEEPKRRLRKSRTSSFGSIISIDDLRAPSLSVPSIPTSSVVSDDDFKMDYVNPNPPTDDAESVDQLLVVLDAVLKNAEGVVKGAKFLKTAIRKLGLAEDSDDADA